MSIQMSWYDTITLGQFAKEGNIQKLAKTFKRYNVCKASKKSAMIQAVLAENIDVVEFLMDKNVDTNIRYNDQTLIEYAASKGNINIVKTLAKDKRSLTENLLVCAHDSIQSEVTEMVIKSKLFILSDDDVKFLKEDAHMRKLQHLENLYANKRFNNPSEKYKEKFIDAALDGYVNVMKNITRQGFDVNSMKPGHLQSIIIEAAEKGHANVIDFIAINHNDEKIMDKAFLRASHHNYSDAIPVLMPKVSDINTTNQDGLTAIEDAAVNGAKDVFDAISLDRKSWKPSLFFIAHKDIQTHVSVTLIERGFDIKTAINPINGDTIYHDAMRRDLFKVFIYYKRYGGNTELKNNDGMTGNDIVTNGINNTRALISKNYGNCNEKE